MLRISLAALLIAGAAGMTGCASTYDAHGPGYYAADARPGYYSYPGYNPPVVVASLPVQLSAAHVLSVGVRAWVGSSELGAECDGKSSVAAGELWSGAWGVSRSGRAGVAVVIVDGSVRGEWGGVIFDCVRGCARL